MSMIHSRRRALCLTLLAAVLLLPAACSSPTPNSPVDAPPGLEDGADAGDSAPAMGLPTMIPPGGGVEFFSITVEPTDDLGYPPPPTLTHDEKSLLGYPAPGDAASTDGDEGAGEEAPGDGEGEDGSGDGDGDEAGDGESDSGSDG